MPIMTNGVFQNITDRVAFQSKCIDDAITLAKPVGTGLFFTKVTAVNDFDVENPLINPAHTLDDNMANFSGTERTLLSNAFSSVISAIGTHISAVGAGSGITTQDAFMTLSGINVSYHYDNAYSAAQGQHLNAINVFGPQKQIATYTATGSGTGTFAHLTALGTGSGKATSTNYCAASFEAIVEVAIDGGRDLQLDVKTLKEDGSASSKGVTIPAGTASGVGFDLGTFGADVYLDATNIVAAGGTALDKIVIVNKIERNIAL